MSLRPIFTLATALTWASCVAASENAPAPEGEVRASSRILASYTRPAVDHVVTYAVSRRFGPGDGDRITIWRHGQLIREMVVPARRPGSPAKITTFSNFATGAFAREFANADGSGQFHFARSRGSRFRIERTNEMRTVASEQCRTWRTEQIDGGWAADAVHAACVADDGVVLYDASLNAEGTVLEERTALQVERRPVAAADAMPSRDVLDWSAWQKDMKDLPRGATGRPENYELWLKRKASRYGEPDSVRYRASSGWFSSESWLKGKLQGIYLRHSSGALGVNKTGSSLIVFSREPHLLPRAAKHIDRKGRKVLGEECSWFDAEPNAIDSFRHECRARDGLPLIIEEGGQSDADPLLVAVSVTRGKTPLRKVMLPAGTLHWAKWGWPELERR